MSWIFFTGCELRADMALFMLSQTQVTGCLPSITRVKEKLSSVVCQQYNGRIIW